MLSVILTILKIIGLIILLILGLLLLILLLVLFVPFRYRVKVEHGDIFWLDGGVSWLLHIIHGRINITDQGNRICLRVFGFLIYDSTKGKRKSKTNDKFKHHKTEYKKADKSLNNVETQEKDECKNLEEDTGQADKHDITLDVEKDVKLADEQETKKIAVDGIKYEENIKHVDKQDIKLDDSDYKKTSKKSLKSKIVTFFKRIKQKINDFIKKLFNIKHKVGLIVSFIRNEVNKEAFRLTFASLFKLIKHILPRQFKSKLLFGTGDPCSTGQALGVLSILYSFYGDKIEITPDFENKVLKGSHFAKGRIRIWSILIIVIKLLLDERIKKFKVNYQRLKEEF